MSTRCDPPRSKRRGSVLLLVLFLLLVLAMMGTAFAILLPVEMRNAQRDRANLQTAYAADAGVLFVMGKLEEARDEDSVNALAGLTATLDREWDYRVVSVQELPGQQDVFRVITEGIRTRGSSKDTLRRAIALVDNGFEGAEATFLVSSAGPDGTGAMGGPNTHWPGNVPIKGDVIVSGMWAVDDSTFNAADGPLVTGVVRQTDGSGNGLRGENYKGGQMPQEDYPDMYSNGLTAVQTIDANELPEGVFLAVDATRIRVQQHLFESNDTSVINGLNNAVNSQSGLHLALDSTGRSNGGVALNGGDYDIVFSVDASGNSIMTLTGAALNNVYTLDGSTGDTTPNPVAGAPTTGNSFQIIHASKPGSYGSVSVGAGEEYLIVRNTATNEIVYSAPADFSGGSVIYSGESLTARGTYTGNKTVAAGGGMSITGELLKDGLARGDSPTSEEGAGKLLGLIANLNPSNSSEGFRMNITSNSPDNQYHIYASIMGLAKTDVNTKLFGHNLHGTIPNNAEFHLYGQLASGPSNGGQFKKELEFIEEWVAELVADELPLGWPTRGANFRSRLRAYVDQQTFDTE